MAGSSLETMRAREVRRDARRAMADLLEAELLEDLPFEHCVRRGWDDGEVDLVCAEIRREVARMRASAG